MKKSKRFYGIWVLAICIAVAGFSLYVAQAETVQQQQERAQFKADVNKQLEEMGMPLFTGTGWQKAIQTEKVGFVWGVCHVVTIEQMLMQKLPSLKVENFSAKAAEGLAGLKINDIVRSVDEYYVANPSKLEVPVLRVMWDTLIKPKLKTGIAGHPLQ